MATWPSQLPGFNSGLQEQALDGFVRTPTSIGPGIQRRRYSATPHYFTGEMTFTREQRATFDAFFNTDLAGGANSFTMQDPTTGQTATFRFVRTPQFNIFASDAGNIFVANIALERLP